jgi:hypothetical protein
MFEHSPAQLSPFSNDRPVPLAGRRPARDRRKSQEPEEMGRDDAESFQIFSALKQNRGSFDAGLSEGLEPMFRKICETRGGHSGKGIQGHVWIHGPSGRGKSSCAAKLQEQGAIDLVVGPRELYPAAPHPGGRRVALDLDRDAKGSG